MNEQQGDGAASAGLAALARTVTAVSPSSNGHAQSRRLAVIASRGTLDYAYPPLILATTAASMGWEAAIYFTFYGLYIVHKDYQQHLQVSPVGNPAMPPPIAAFPQLKVPNLLGSLPGMTAVATSMMEGWMARAHLAPIMELLDIARELGVKLYACNTIIGVMGIDPGDLMDGVERVGSPAFLDFAAEADIQLFI